MLSPLHLFPDYLTGPSSWEIWTDPTGNIHKEPPEILPHNSELCLLKYALRFPVLVPDNIAYMRTD